MKMQPKLKCGAVSGLIILFFLGFIGVGRSQTTVTNSDPAEVRAAIEKGGDVVFAFDGRVDVNGPFSVTADTTVDAAGRAVTLNGSGRSRHFVLTNAVTLRLINLVLENGTYFGNGAITNESGEPALGGSIYNHGGRIELIDCKFMTNQTVGGEAGPLFSFPAPVPTRPHGGFAFGGAVYCAEGSLLISNCVFASNLSQGGTGGTAFGDNSTAGGHAFGGAIYMSNSPTTISQSLFANNTTKGGELAKYFVTPVGGGGSAFGGAVYGVQNDCVVSNVVFAGNSALGAMRIVEGALSTNESGGAYGGAIFHESGVAKFYNTLFRTNLAFGGPYGRGAGVGSGGAVYAKSGSVGFNRCALMTNEASGGKALITSSLSPLEAGDAFGGGVYSKLALADLAFINCTLAGNSANGGEGTPYGIQGVSLGGSAYGGAIFGDVSLLNTTFSGNSAQVGYGWIPNVPGLAPPTSAGGSIAGDIVLTNTILVCATGQTNIFGLANDGGHNICSDGSANFISPSSRGNLDPLLAPQADNGGFTPTCALLPRSPAFDSGDDSVCPATDQRGVPRPQGLHCDIGAFELEPEVTIEHKSSGVFLVKSQFAAGKANEVLSSTNLVDWVYRGSSFADTNGVSIFEDMGSPFVSRQFYQFRPTP